jgi:hypothetical protein
MEAICWSSSDAVPSQELPYGDVLPTFSILSEMTAGAGYASNNHSTLYYGDHPHDHIKSVGTNTLSHGILSPYSHGSTIPMSSIPLGQMDQ